MPTPSTKVKVFVASPGDVTREREEFAAVIKELNVTIEAIAPEKGIVLELIQWQTHVHPGLGLDAQDVVNQQIGSYDIFVGIMWKRFGTATGRADSGTEEEFKRALAQWEKDRTLPVLFYFCQEMSTMPKAEEFSQLAKVVAFREEVSKRGLVWDYGDHGCFADLIRPHLVLVLSKMFPSKQAARETPEESLRNRTESDLGVARQQVRALGQEYDELRKSMEAGPERTRLMSSIKTRMGALSLSIYPLLPELMVSPSAGERLAAVAALQGKPSPEPKYLTWLADRVGVEQPFVGYQASVALLLAVRVLGPDHRQQTQAAVRLAQELLGKLNWQDPNQVRQLENAQSELDAMR
jgi:hypothetical protein